MRQWLGLLVFVMILTACVPVRTSEPGKPKFIPLVAANPSDATPVPSVTTEPVKSASTSTVVLNYSGVADLLRDPPPPGQNVEFDAYFSGRPGTPHPGGPAPDPNQVLCPRFPGFFTDQPLLSILLIVTGIHGNFPPDDAPWLIATIPSATRPGVSIGGELFPYHARFRGYLGEPAFAHCEDADRIFVVEHVIAVYESDPPDPYIYRARVPSDYPDWITYHDPSLGYSLRYPPGWSVEPLNEPNALSAVALRAPQWPDYPIVVRVHPGEVHYDQYDGGSRPLLLQGSGFAPFQQMGRLVSPFGLSEEQLDNQGLAGYLVTRTCPGHPDESSSSVVFSAHGHTYEVALCYLLGVDAPQPLLTVYSVIVQIFRLDVLPGPTPTPPIKQSLGPGPFLTLEDVLSLIQERYGDEVEVSDMNLMSEAEARHVEASACRNFFGHPDGVWMLTVRGVFVEGGTATIRMGLDATTGAFLCGEEISGVPRHAMSKERSLQ